MEELKVKDFMFKEAKVVQRATTLRELLNMFQKFHSPPLIPVVEKNGTLVAASHL